MPADNRRSVEPLVLTGALFPVAGWVEPALVADHLTAHHYLGPTRRGMAWVDRYGVMVLASPPTSRRLPADWLELTRWCLTGERNGGSRQWAAVRRHLQAEHPATTVVSYSDPSAGHSGALYKACGWRWAPTWHRLRPPPSGNGRWTDDTVQSVKDRWVYPLRADPRRVEVLAVNDESLQAAGCPQYTEP